MSVFGFIENFFFISLAIVFVLISLLVYHFKTRITVAEKKSESMYELLTAVVKEIKTLRGMFGLGGGSTTETQQPVQSESVSTKIQEANVIQPQYTSNEDVYKNAMAVPDNSTGMDQLVQNIDLQQENRPNRQNVVNIDFSASDNKIVVSDMEEDDEESSEDDSDYLSSTSYSSYEESDGELELEPELAPFVQLIPEKLMQSEPTTKEDTEPTTKEESAPTTKEDTAPTTKEDTEPIQVSLDLEEFVESVKVLPSNEKYLEVSLDNLKSTEIQFDASYINVDLSSVSPQVPSVDQLRKMNINQLKTIASQLGISSDVTKMKKPELISLIREGRE